MSKVLIDRELLERIRDVLWQLAHRNETLSAEAECIGTFLPDLLAQPAADCGLEVVAYLDSDETLYSTRLLNFLDVAHKGADPLVRKSDADARIAELEADKARLVEDRARFPDQPDFIGNMIAAQFGNLRAGKDQADKYADKCRRRMEQAEEELNDRIQNVCQLQAELDGLKAQEPVFMWHKGATDDESEVVDVDCACPCCVQLYAAPVKQEVVMPPYSDERGSDGKLTYEAVAHNRCLDEVARLNGGKPNE